MTILIRIAAWLLTVAGMVAAFAALVLFADLMRDVDRYVMADGRAEGAGGVRNVWKMCSA